jgi:Kef-type K+ transport system membrane component KefB
VNVTDVLVDILVVLLAAKLAAEVAERLGVPAVIGEILAGVLIGPSVLELVGSTEVLSVLGELGVILLLLDVGLELSLGELAAVGKSSLRVASVGVLLPVAAGFAVASSFGRSGNVALFVGAALAATSVGITARVFSDLGALTRVEARTVLGAAVADDVMGLVLLTIVVRLATADSISAVEVAGVIAVAIVFLVLAVALGTRYLPRLLEGVDRYARSPGTFVALALAFTLAFAALADAAELAPIVGAFAAGVAMSGSGPAERVKRELKPVGHLFIPVFFLQIGVDADLSVFTKPSLLALVGALLVVAIVGKVLAGAATLSSPGDKLLVGLGMLPRGEVGLIFASIGLTQGVLGKGLYGAIVAVVLGTTLLAPPVLRWRLNQLKRRHQQRPQAPAPPGGWLRVTGDEVGLADVPPDEEVLVLALEAALLMSTARPSSELLDWLGRADASVAVWDGRATARLLAILRDGSVRSWRFLETTGVLERALPELASALHKRRADPFLLDPTHVLQFDLVEKVRDIVHRDPRAAATFERLRQPERPLLAALVIAAVGDSGDPVDLAQALSRRLRLGGLAESELVALVADRSLLRAAALRIDALDEEPVLQLASHLETPERARALYVLSLALGDLGERERDQLDELLSRILKVQGRPELTGPRAESLVDRRRNEAIALLPPESSAVDWVRTAPRAYLLATPPADVARHVMLMEPLPRRGTARVTVVPLGNREGRIEVAARDRPGLIAVVSGVITELGLDVTSATMATWPNKEALESFDVRLAPSTPALPDEVTITTAIEQAYSQPLESPPQPDLELTFDDDGSPWHTLCEVRGRDRPGLLRSVAAGFAVSLVSVHSARIETRADVAIDRFEVSDVDGRKLDEAHKRAAIAAIHNGVHAQANGRHRRPRWLRRRSSAQHRGLRDSPSEV